VRARAEAADGGAGKQVTTLGALRLAHSAISALSARNDSLAENAENAEGSEPQALRRTSGASHSAVSALPARSDSLAENGEWGAQVWARVAALTLRSPRSLREVS